MSLVRLAITRPVTALVMLVVLMVLGAIAIQRVPLAFLPEVDVPIIVIQVPHPDRSPRQVEREVVEPIEDALSTLSGIKSLRSTATADGASFVLEFEWGESLDVIRMQVTEKVKGVRGRLPEQARRMTVESFNTADIPVVEARISAEGVDLSASYPLLETHVLDPLRRIPGVARVQIDGVKPRQVYVDLIADRILSHGVEVGALVQRLQAASAEAVLGEVGEGGQRLTVRGEGSFDSLEGLGELPVGIGDLRLSDIAEISYVEPPIGYGRHLGREDAIGLSVYKDSTANTVDVVDAVRATIEGEIDTDPMLNGVRLFVWEDQAEHIRAGIQGLQRAGLIGALMAVLCLYAFLRRMDSTLIVALSIPFSVVVACGALFFLGKTLNLLSMMGLMLGVGMLVDNAIVVLESIDRKRDEEPDIRRAARLGAGQVTGAVTVATATTLIVFLPLVLGGASELTVWLKEVGVTISLALGCSLLSSLTLIPLMSTKLLRARTKVEPRQVSRVERAYGAVLAWTFRHPWWGTLGLVLSLVVGVFPLVAEQVQMQPFSGQVNERLSIDYEFTDFHYKSEAERTVSKVEAYLDEHREEFGISEIYSYFAENQAGTTIVLERADLDDEGVKALRARIREGLPTLVGAKAKFFEQADAGGSSTYFSVQLYGRESDALEPIAEQVKALLGEFDGAQDISTSFQHGRDEIEVAVDRERAQRRGITAEDAAQTFGFTLGGLPLPRFRDGQREVDTWLALRIEDRAGLEDLRSITFPVPDGLPVRLGDISQFRTVKTPMSIERENRRTNASVRATYEGDDWMEVREKIEARLNEMEFPNGYDWSWDRWTLERDSQGEEMGVNFLLALALVYLVLAAQFESLTQPLAIVLSILFALPGAAWMLMVTGTPLNLMAQIGLLILMGVVVNNGVVLLDRTNQLRAQGHPARDAFVMAGRDRLRPIVMTATTTILGLVPLAIGGSAVGGLFYFPLARAVMGGLLSGALLTLLALPLLTTGLEGLAGVARRWWRTSA
ncbi:MAG: efflux RND transporter permease subunit [Deltaproteobacteria bacterium]|nr:efflux RND transporter permease subunit [Deltaproteobacteria bacterium]